ncbi:MAG TPA: GHKL domain-containing protein [Ruminococcus sp.]
MTYFLDCITLFLTVMLCGYLLYGKYPLRKTNMVRRTILVISGIIVKALVIFFKISPLNFITNFLMIVLIIRLLFNCNKSSLFIYAALFAMITLCSDVLSVIIVSIFHKNTISVTMGATSLAWNHHLWDWLIQIVLTRIAKLLILKKGSIQNSWHEIIFYIFLILFEVGIFAYFSYVTHSSSSGFLMLLIMVGFLFLDLYIIYIFNKISHLREKEHQTDLMNQREQMQLQMYNELQKMYRTTCEAAHDINRHVTALKKWISGKSGQKAEKYLSDLSDTAKQLQPRIRNQNEILEIILNTVASTCEREQIKLDMDIEDFSMKFISDMDITTIFSNLLDNAVDACMEIENAPKTIQIVLCQKMGLIALRITNTCIYKGEELPQKWHSTKKNHTGIGLSNVQKTVEKYEGVVSVKTKQEIFQVSVTLPIDKM